MPRLTLLHLLGLVAHARADATNLTALKDAFQEMLDELAAACESAGIVLVRQQVITMMRNLDTSQDGKVSIEEFLRAFGVAIDKE